MKFIEVRREWSTASLLANSSDHAVPAEVRYTLPPDAVSKPTKYQSHWACVMCVMGLSYFSTLSYQPTIAFQALGLLAPLATVVLVALTLFGALPVARRVAHKSPHGQGSIGLVERLLGGWAAKVLVVVVIGFAATNFVTSATLSAADAAEHLIHNPYFASSKAVIQNQMFVAMTLLVLLGAVFLRGFRVLTNVAVALAGIYLFLNLIIIASGLWHLATHVDLLTAWHDNVVAGRWYCEHVPAAGHGALSTSLICMLFFPQLALGLSGFETGIAIMPLVRGDENDDLRKPEGRIRNTQKLLTAGALIMSFMLLGSSIVTSLLIHPGALRSGGPAANRALAFIAHGETAALINPLFGTLFGTIYDISTVAVLWFAAATAISVLRHLMPRYLLKFGVSPKSPASDRWLALLLMGLSLLLTWIFGASVEVQAGVCTTAALALITNSCLAVAIVDWNRRRGPWYARFSWRYFFVILLFACMTVAVIIKQPAGLLMAAGFVFPVFVASIIPRRTSAQALPAA